MSQCWSNAFYKFGYDDGDGVVETPIIAAILESEGYQVKYRRWSPHNTIIYSITYDGQELMPLHSSQCRIGYDDPRDYLPVSVLHILHRHHAHA